MKSRLEPRARYNLGGLTMAVVAFCLSLTPSLLPRDWVLQGTISGMLTGAGYGIGVLLAIVVRRIVPRGKIVVRSRLLWRVFAVWAAAVVPLFLYLGSAWQHDIRKLVGATQPARYGYVLILLVAVLLAAALLEISRLLRQLTRRVSTRLDRWLPAGVAMVLGVITVGLLVLGFLHGVVYDTLKVTANRAFRIINAETMPGDSPPGTAERSGGAGSLVSWSSLGNKGRDFIAGGPTAEELRSFAGEPDLTPIRVYVGLESAPTLEAEAALAVRELQRLGAFSRKVLCVVTATGTGGVDPNAVDAIEYMYNGNSAVVSMQYSYLPSWISFLVDRTLARQAGRELFNAVYARWSEMPRDRRPRLLVYGESLGAFGSEAAFSGAEDIVNRSDGVLWVGPPNDSVLWREFVRQRDAGTREILPVYRRGVTLRFGARPADLDRPAGPWSPPRIAYLQQASDPIVWWSWRLLLHQPDWLREPPGSDVLPAMRWLPVITFLQVSADIASANRSPLGHGHNYGGAPAFAWERIAPPESWTVEKSERLLARFGR